MLVSQQAVEPLPPGASSQFQQQAATEGARCIVVKAWFRQQGDVEVGSFSADFNATSRPSSVSADDLFGVVFDVGSR